MRGEHVLWGDVHRVTWLAKGLSVFNNVIFLDGINNRCWESEYLFAHRLKLCVNQIILCRELKQDKDKTLFGFSFSVFTIILLLWLIRNSTTILIYY